MLFIALLLIVERFALIKALLQIFPAPQVFVGATDSAAPCAMLMEIAYALHELLQEHTSKVEHRLLCYDIKSSI